MTPEEIKSRIADLQAKLASLNRALHKRTCDGVAYSLPEDVAVQEEIEDIEEQIASLKKQLSLLSG